MLQHLEHNLKEKREWLIKTRFKHSFVFLEIFQFLVILFCHKGFKIKFSKNLAEM